MKLSNNEAIHQFASRAGEKLQFALDSFKISVKDLTCADFGSSTGGFTDCLLQNGAKKVYSVDVSYGEFAWKLRNDPRVVVMERTNAMHVNLPEKMDVISIDVGWTKQALILPNAFSNLKKDRQIISLIKPHYEAERQMLVKGRLADEFIDVVVKKVKDDIENAGGKVVNLVESPIVGEKGKNREFLALILPN
jgi:23S rRNA (cytidine1920-2'-O)/16S rRNA (cytidine1409-2'-O)-methyltransferase